MLSTFILKHALFLVLEFRLEWLKRGPEGSICLPVPSAVIIHLYHTIYFFFFLTCFGYQTQIFALHLICWTIPPRPYISYFGLQTKDIKGQQLKLVFTICGESRGSKSSTRLLGSRTAIHLERKYFMCHSLSRTKTGQRGMLLRWLAHPSLAGHLSSLPRATVEGTEIPSQTQELVSNAQASRHIGKRPPACCFLNF